MAPLNVFFLIYTFYLSSAHNERNIEKTIHNITYHQTFANNYLNIIKLYRNKVLIHIYLMYSKRTLFV